MGWIDTLSNKFWGIGMHKDETFQGKLSDIIHVDPNCPPNTVYSIDTQTALKTLREQYTTQAHAQMAQQYQQAMNSSWTNHTTATSPGMVLGNGNYTYTATGNTPYAEHDWSIADNQDAAGKGWFLRGGLTGPTLEALSFGTKKDMTPEELIRDVVEQAMADCSVAKKVLAVLTKNRSPYAEWAKLSESLNGE